MHDAVPLVDLAAAYEELREELGPAWERVSAGGWYLLGPELAAFESEFARYCGAAHCIGVANGLDAIHLTLRALGVGPGDEVIVPSNTYVATWLGVTHAGARPVPVEPDPGTCNIGAAAVAAAITPRTRAILPVHLYGHPADLAPLRALADQHGAWLVADAAQAHGARYRGEALDRHVHASAWSFYPTKNLGALGDGGAVTVHDERVADTLRVLRNYGSRQRYVNEVVGYNSRLEELHAAVLRVKLRHLDAWNARRAEHAAAYADGLAGTSLVLPGEAPWAQHAWHLYVVRSPRRDALREALAARGITSIVHYPVPPHMQQAYGAMGIAPSAFPVARSLADTVLSLPMGPHLQVSARERVIATVREFLHGLGEAA